MKKSFLAGLLIMLPLILTYVLIKFALGLIIGPFEHIVHYILGKWHLFENGLWLFTREQLIQSVSQVCIISAILGLIALIGMLGRWVFFHTIIHYFDKLIRKIPVVNRIYGPSKDLVDALFNAKAEYVRRAVMLPYASNEQLSIGITTGDYVTNIEGQNEHLVSVFIPTTPNATAGYLCTLPKESLTYLDMSADEALKAVMSLAPLQKKND